LKRLYYVVDARVRCAGFVHGPFVQFEVADMSARWILIALFAQDDFVDEKAQFGGSHGDPRRLGAGEVVLEVFKERHEIPDRVYMVFHEALEFFLAVDFVV